MPEPSILLVEDDERLASLVCEYLSQHGFTMRRAARGDEALPAFRKHSVDLIILDLMLPGVDGLELCKQLREVFPGPIMMLTAKGSDIDQVVGLELGADDYVIKPVEPRLLLARIRALLRRFEKSGAGGADLRFGALHISPASQVVRLNGEPVPLTTQEFNLLCLLAGRAGAVLSRDDIYRSLRGIDYDGLDRTVDVCVSHLRRKLGDDGEQPRHIKTVWGKGYLFVADGWG
jgi:DNA-binding response OmpR family regulator